MAYEFKKGWKEINLPNKNKKEENEELTKEEVEEIIEEKINFEKYEL